MQRIVARDVRDLVRAIGPLTASRVLTQSMLRVASPRSARVRTGLSHGVEIVVRPLESDISVAAQIFGREDYKLDPILTEALHRKARDWLRSGDRPVIIDGGANVGYAAIYFAKTYPEATVLAIEPDLETFGMLCRNTRATENIICIRSALWSDDRGVELMHYPPVGSWATKTVAARSGAANDGRLLTPSIRLDQVGGAIPNARILILKLDIEGAERQACASAAAVVGSTPCIIVEPHDFIARGSGSLSPLFTHLAKKDVDTYVSGENIVFADSSLFR